MAGLYYNMTFNNIFPENRYARLATIPVIEKSEIQRDRYTIIGRDGELLGIDEWRNNAHVQLTLHTKVGWMDGMGQRNLDDLLNSLNRWLSGTGMLHIINNEYGLYSNAIAYRLEVLQITKNEVRKDNKYGRLEVDFEVYPYNFIPSGSVRYDSEGNSLTLTNDYDECKPTYYLSGSGSGTLSVNGKTMGYTLTSGEWLTIDTRRMIAYSGTTNKSGSVNGDYKDLWLPNGSSIITVSSGHIFKVLPEWGYKL